MSSNLSNPNFRYYPMTSPVLYPRSPTERLWKALRIVEPALEDSLRTLSIVGHRIRTRPEKMFQLFLSGIYALYDGDTLLSVAIIECNKINRIITLPRFRRKGYSSLLVKHIAEKMKECGICVICPVDKHIEPLFYKLGWVKDTTPCPDGCYDFYLPEHTTEYRQMVQGEFGYDFEPFSRHLSEIVVE
jgi:GNAT superfamily N-acetyltransferase